MDLKQEPSDPYEGVVKREPYASGQTEENDPTEMPFKNHDSKCEYPDTDTEYFVNISQIKKEIVECVVPKIEYQLSDYPEKIDCNSIKFISGTIKKELDVHDVDIGETKQEVSDSEYIQFKTESELLTTHCDLPTLKIENVEYLDIFEQPCSSKYARKTIKTEIITLKTTKNVIKKKLYPCLVCQKNFSSSKSRLIHINRHFGKIFVICKFCGKFTTKFEFFRHYFVHLVKNRPIQGSLKVNNVPSIHQHLIIHTKEEPFKCDICFKRFKRKSNLDVHLIFHTNRKPYKCDICSKVVKRKYDLQQHLRVVHSDKKPFKCDICSNEFKRKKDITQHSLIHTDEKPFKCDICFKQFKRKSNLSSHLIIHANEKQFKCDICSKLFNHKYNLYKHLTSHTNEKPFKCDFCSKEYKRKFSLKEHLKNTHTNEKTIECDICYTKFNRKSNLRQHLKITHANVKPFKCDICSKEFKTNYVLRRHITSHTNGKTIKCDICTKTFKRKDYLDRHLLIHTDDNKE